MLKRSGRQDSPRPSTLTHRHSQCASQGGGPRREQDPCAWCSASCSRGLACTNCSAEEGRGPNFRSTLTRTHSNTGSKSLHVSWTVGSGSYKGLDQSDVGPRNVVVIPHPGAQLASAKGLKGLLARLRVVLVDYNLSIIYCMSKWRKRPFEGKRLPPNPMENYRDQSLSAFNGWIPPEWNQRPRLRQEWLLERFGRQGVMDEHETVTEKLEFEADEF